MTRHQSSAAIPELVENVFSSFPPNIQAKMLMLRRLILRVAAENIAIGPLEETLKWGEPAYLTSQTGAGTTIRLSWSAKSPNQYRLMVNCQTTLVDSYRTLFPELDFEGNRALVLDLDCEVDPAAISQCIEMALTYHIAKKRKRPGRV